MMKLVCFSLILSIFLPTLVSGAAKVVTIPGELKGPVTPLDTGGGVSTGGGGDDWKVNVGTRVLLDQGLLEAFVRSDGKFLLHQVPQGSYLLTVQHAEYSYPTYRLTVKIQGQRANLTLKQITWGNAWDEGEEGEEGKIPYPFTLYPESKVEYFTKREGFNLWGLFMSPYMLMMGVSMLMMFALPKLMGSLDPEALKDFQQSQKDMKKLTQGGDISQTLANMMTTTAASGGGGGGGDAGEKNKKKK